VGLLASVALLQTIITLMKQYKTGLVWFRRDLRAHDHAALYHALKQCEQVHCVFVFDREIIDSLPKDDRRVSFIYDSVLELNETLQQLGGELIVRHAWASDEIPFIAKQLNVNVVFTNHDYEPQALLRDAKVSIALMNEGIAFHTYKDQVIFEKSEVLTQMGKPYGVFTPYKNMWLKQVNDFYLKAYPVEDYAKSLAKSSQRSSILSLGSMGFTHIISANEGIIAGVSGAKRLLTDFLKRMDKYDEARNYPAVKGPSYLSVHLRFGTVSIRELARAAHARMEQSAGAATWLSELIWRDFYFQILHHHPHVAVRAFKPEYDRIAWSNNEAHFKAWCEARTGYPLVDAAMRQLNQTGYMHNRLRMVVASFLIKDLGIDWRWGETYFAEKLIDFDLSANNGGWQWAASSGCDAQPYFRIFNPTSQSEKFDAQGKFIRRYVPELAALNDKDIHAPWQAKPIDLLAAGIQLGKDYPLPIVQHDEARAQTLTRYVVVKHK
jgi:deoxyribodipyrimidine photo-lyase